MALTTWIHRDESVPTQRVTDPFLMTIATRRTQNTPSRRRAIRFFNLMRANARETLAYSTRMLIKI